MLELGNVNSEKVKEEFLEKFKETRKDYEEYDFGSIKGEKLETTVYHKPCGKVFKSRPYLFIQEGWQKKCPYCYPYKKNKLELPDIIERVEDYSNGRFSLERHEEKYIGRQKIHHVYLKCKDCGFEFSRNLQNMEDGTRCPSCNNLE